jgi:hypothetical protein
MPDDLLADLATALRIVLGMRWAFPTDSQDYALLQTIAERHHLLHIEQRNLTNDSISLQCKEDAKDGGQNGN